jgi:EpsI family protein
MIRRIVILSACLLLGASVMATASRTEKVPAREPLSLFPVVIDKWRGQNTTPLTPEVLKVLGADDYLSRVYWADGDAYASLYVGYYESQRQGDTIHSPLNCLPGAGWRPVAKSYISIPVTAADGSSSTITVNRYVIEKGLERQVALYWYQSHGRVIANEYRSKAFMIYDAVRLNRSDAALVRVMSPRIGSGENADAEAEARVADFVKAMFPLLGRFLPS